LVLKDFFERPSLVRFSAKGKGIGGGIGGNLATSSLGMKGSVASQGHRQVEEAVGGIRVPSPTGGQLVFVSLAVMNLYRKISEMASGSNPPGQETRNIYVWLGTVVVRRA